MNRVASRPALLAVVVVVLAMALLALGQHRQNRADTGGTLAFPLLRVTPGGTGSGVMLPPANY
ncbi:hypothetical protein [Deinococcus pimensis]|uniref:hypothetical protein n=1 Tax=Deinococcus pimensis TaxID=309888 RepID=UPI000482D9DA|nr:hypothetical protein [Deinococcus pimensis]